MKDEAEKYITALANTIESASLHFDIWWVYKEQESRLKYVDTLNNYLNFFQTSLQAHFISIVIELYKIFETRKETINFSRLIKLIARDNLLEPDTLSKIQANKKVIKDLWRKIAILRSELFAHISIDLSYNEIFQKADITPNQLKDLIEKSKNLLNQILESLDKNTYSFELEATEDTVRVLENLKHIKKNNSL
jgi:hypothetical protein